MALLSPLLVPGAADGPFVSPGCAQAMWNVGEGLSGAGVVLCFHVCPCVGTLCSFCFLVIAEVCAMSEEMDITEMQSSTACPRQQWGRFILAEYEIR